MGHLVGQRRLSVVVVLTLVAGLLAAGSTASPGAYAGEETRLLVTYDTEVAAGTAAAGFRTASVVADEHRPDSRVQVLAFPGRSEAASAARRLAQDSAVLHVEPDTLIRIEPLATSDTPGDTTSDTPGDAAAATSATPATSATTSTGAPTPHMWPIDNDGQRLDGQAGRRGVDVGAVAAWPHATGVGVVVAVIDAGVDVSHPALADAIWRNPRERADGRDTDGNGFVDDLGGWNFVHDTNQVYRDPVADAHGTMVAGAIVSRRDPATGAGGVAPGARVMPLKFIDGEAGYTSDAVAAVRYAAANGADVINLSFGSAQSSLALRTALAESGLPVVAAAGNHGASLEVSPIYPAAFDLPNLVTVAAVDHTGVLAEFSGYSQRLVDVAAPGRHVYTTVPGGGHQFASGTSLSAPLVSGVLALALERHPDVHAEELADAVRRSARPLTGASRTMAGGLAMAPALLASLGTEVPVCAPGALVAFADVRTDSVHHDAVGCLVATGVTVGTTATTFSPYGELTRGQVATLLARIVDRAGLLPDPPTVARFVDAGDAGAAHADNLERLAALGVLQVAGDRVRPAEVVSRAEFATLAARTAELVADGSIRLALFPELTDGGFADLAEVTTRAEVLKAAAIRVTTGRTTDSFEPDTPVRRDQAASMLVRLLSRLGEQGLVDAA